MPFSLVETAACRPFSLHASNTALAIPQKALYKLYGHANAILHDRLGASPEDLDIATRILLLQTPEHATAGNIRRRLLRRWAESLSAEAIAGQLRAELAVVGTLLRVDSVAKSSVLWSHRRYILAWLLSVDGARTFVHLAPLPLATITAQDLQVELQLAARCCEIYNRNYWAWTHRLILYEAVSQRLADPRVHCVLIDELVAVKDRLAASLSDHSAFVALARLTTMLADETAALDEATDLAQRFPNHQPAPDAVLFAFPSTEQLSSSLGKLVIKAQDDALSKRETFRIAISGGSLAKQLNGLVGPELVGRCRWDKWEVFFADERVVPLDDEESNYRVVNEGLLSKIPAPGIPPEQIHTIDASKLSDPEAVADDYEQQLMEVFAGKNSVAFPRFDVILLGMGPDGHTCSLFPGHPLLTEDLRWVAYVDDSPKPPSTRITLTLPVLNHAHRAVFVTTGAGKQDMLERVFDHHAAMSGAHTTSTGERRDTGSGEAPANASSASSSSDLPCARVKPVAPGRAYWLADEAALGKVKSFPRTPFNIDDPKL